MKSSWKTTLCGLVALIGGALVQFFPEFAKLGGFLASIGSGAGLLFARDFDKSRKGAGAGAAVPIPISRPPESTPTQRSASPLPPILLALGLAALCGAILTGCASFSTHQTDTSTTDENGNVSRTITTKATSRTLLDSRASLANFKASQTDKTQGASVGSLTQEASSTNAVTALGHVAEILKAVK